VTIFAWFPVKYRFRKFKFGPDRRFQEILPKKGAWGGGAAGGQARVRWAGQKQGKVAKIGWQSGQRGVG
jgi:hypothetical protein